MDPYPERSKYSRRGAASAASGLSESDQFEPQRGYTGSSSARGPSTGTRDHTSSQDDREASSGALYPYRSPDHDLNQQFTNLSLDFGSPACAHTRGNNGTKVRVLTPGVLPSLACSLIYGKGLLMLSNGVLMDNIPRPADDGAETTQRRPQIPKEHCMASK